MYTTILTLYKQGISQRQISKIAKVHRATIKKIIARYDKEGIEEPSIKSSSSKLLNWHQQIVMLLEKNLSYIRVHEELKSMGCDASYTSLRRYINKHNIISKTCIRFNTDPGLEAQVDFGDIGKRYDPEGKLRKAYIFNMRLSYSRFDYYEIVFDQKVETWINCHINAFNYFAGVPRVIKLDNLKAGIIDANFHEPLYQRVYKMLADHYDCSLSPCRPYQPQEKGKVESGIKYVKNNFLAGREFINHADMTKQLDVWMEKANMRIHGTTRAKPKELFESEEHKFLGKLPLLDFDMATWSCRKVAKDCHITFDNNYYSVPSKYVGADVDLLVDAKLIKVFYKDQQVALHARSKGKGIFTTNNCHYPKSARYSPGFAEYDEKLESIMQDMGPNCLMLLKYLQKTKPLDWWRAVKGIIKLRENYGDDVIDKACHRGLCYGVTSYRKIKSILDNNCYDLPIHDAGDGYAGRA